MNKDYKIKISAKGSKKTGDEFIKETTCLAGMVDCIEIDFNFPHDNNFGAEMKFLKKLSKEKNIKYTTHAQYLNGSLNDLNKEVREVTLKELFKNIDLTADLGARIMTLHPALEPYGLKLKERIDLEIKAYQEIADYASRKNIEIGLENEAQTGIWFPDRACKFKLLKQTAETVNRANFGFTLDIGHASVSGEDYIAAIKKLNKKIFHIHAHDNLGKPENNLSKYNRPDPHLAPGRGTINWKNIVNTLRKINYERYFELECEINEMKTAVDFISDL